MIPLMPTLAKCMKATPNCASWASPLVALTVVIGPSIELPVLIVILRAVLWMRERDWFNAGRATGTAARSAR